MLTSPESPPPSYSPYLTYVESVEKKGVKIPTYPQPLKAPKANNAPPPKGREF